MSSQKQCRRFRRLNEATGHILQENAALRRRLAYFERRPPWWKLWARRAWREEDSIRKEAHP